ncbi:hypothetical protein HBI55_035540 [Parastagonospora nodorum]|nr:hypothetical protein HBI05_083240 [Parastagonospora nodorum]KAH4243685.1 hypothetical protein HBI06_008240 [Parastagonospora nodorum]KAH4948687.1 hypothetical protein HBH74_032170 [Parastagonospora nodorum]KAH4982846.1 hypothetical protein HBH73_028470 [Parastagonospora nodorum]KAH5191977.1 hypothetical protein HBH76_073460 [Parastagonospora nodorum]
MCVRSTTQDASEVAIHHTPKARHSCAPFHSIIRTWSISLDFFIVQLHRYVRHHKLESTMVFL